LVQDGSCKYLQEPLVPICPTAYNNQVLFKYYAIFDKPHSETNVTIPLCEKSSDGNLKTVFSLPCSLLLAKQTKFTPILAANTIEF